MFKRTGSQDGIGEIPSFHFLLNHALRIIEAGFTIGKHSDQSLQVRGGKHPARMCTEQHSSYVAANGYWLIHYRNIYIYIYECGFKRLSRVLFLDIPQGLRRHGSHWYSTKWHHASQLDQLNKEYPRLQWTCAFKIAFQQLSGCQNVHWMSMFQKTLD